MTPATLKAVPTEQPTIDDLARELIDAKKAEADARDARIAIEERIVEALPGALEQTCKGIGANYKLTVTRGITRSVDSDAVKTAYEEFPQMVKAALVWKASLSLPVLRKLTPAESQIISKYYTSKPAKPAVKVELV